MSKEQNKKLSRRSFLKIGLLWGSVVGFGQTACSIFKKDSKRFFTRDLFKQNLEQIISTIIPVEKNRKKTCAKARDYILQKIENEKSLKQMYKEGNSWLKRTLERIYGEKNFSLLDRRQREEFFRIFLDGKESSKLREKFDPNALGFNYLRQVSFDTFDYFYTSSFGWNLFGYDGPPQFGGFIDYYKKKTF